MLHSTRLHRLAAAAACVPRWQMQLCCQQALGSSPLFPTTLVRALVQRAARNRRLLAIDVQECAGGVGARESGPWAPHQPPRGFTTAAAGVGGASGSLPLKVPDCAGTYTRLAIELGCRAEGCGQGGLGPPPAPTQPRAAIGHHLSMKLIRGERACYIGNQQLSRLSCSLTQAQQAPSGNSGPRPRQFRPQDAAFHSPFPMG